MIANLLGLDYKVVEELLAAAICGEDFCDSCGDCLYCYGGDECPYGSHVRYVYAEDIEEWREAHPDARPWSWESVLHPMSTDPA